MINHQMLSVQKRTQVPVDHHLEMDFNAQHVFAKHENELLESDIHRQARYQQQLNQYNTQYLSAGQPQFVLSQVQPQGIAISNYRNPYYDHNDWNAQQRFMKSAGTGNGVGNSTINNSGSSSDSSIGSSIGSSISSNGSIGNPIGNVPSGVPSQVWNKAPALYTPFPWNANNAPPIPQQQQQKQQQNPQQQKQQQNPQPSYQEWNRGVFSNPEYPLSVYPVDNRGYSDPLHVTSQHVASQQRLPAAVQPQQGQNPADPENPHQCHLCDKSFKRKSWLKRHLLSHSSIKPFNCPWCQSRHKRKDNLLQHMKLKHTPQVLQELQSAGVHPIVSNITLINLASTAGQNGVPSLVPVHGDMSMMTSIKTMIDDGTLNKDDVKRVLNMLINRSGMSM